MNFMGLKFLEREVSGSRHFGVAVLIVQNVLLARLLACSLSCDVRPTRQKSKFDSSSSKRGGESSTSVVYIQSDLIIQILRLLFSIRTNKPSQSKEPYYYIYTPVCPYSTLAASY